MSIENNIDPDLLSIMQSMPALQQDDWDLETILAARADLPPPTRADAPDPTVHIENRTIPRQGDKSDLLMRIYQPAKRTASQALPALLWIHGGGFIVGDVYSEEGLCEQIVSACNCVVVSVDYRLAPQHPFPAGLDDCHTALSWLRSSALEELSIDKNRIAIGGVSAGGCLAAGLALRNRDEGGHKLIFQVLMIPVIDDRHETPSSHSITDPRVWNRSVSLKAWDAYLKDIKCEVTSYAAPGRADDLTGLPPTFVSVEDQDLLRDEGIAYAQGLMQAGVQTELHVYPGTFHGSVFAPDANVSRRHRHDMKQALNRAFWRAT